MQDDQRLDLADVQNRFHVADRDHVSFSRKLKPAAGQRRLNSLLNTEFCPLIYWGKSAFCHKFSKK